MILKRVGPLSVAKIAAVLYALMGFLFGACLSVFSLISGMVRPQESAGPLANAFGVGAVIWMPFFYGSIGFVGSLVTAALYNGVAKFVGGITLELEAPAAQDNALGR